MRAWTITALCVTCLLYAAVMFDQAGTIAILSGRPARPALRYGQLFAVVAWIGVTAMWAVIALTGH